MSGTAVSPLGTARAAFERRDWITARDGFRAARDAGDLSGDDFFALAESSWWLGDIDESLAAFEAAHRLYLRERLPRRAALSALYLAAYASARGDGVIGSAWMGRCQRLLRDEPEGPEHGYPLYWAVFSAMGAGDLDGAVAQALQMQEFGRRFDDSNLHAIGVLAEGRALIKKGRVTEGMSLLDDAMLTALSDELHPLWTGTIYCHLMDACRELADFRRAGEWTQASMRWCDQLPEAVLFRGICRVHRAQVLQSRGEWDQAEQEAARACSDLVGISLGTVAEAHYEQGEIRRLRGNLAGAEDAFKRAHEFGRDPQPGLALLRLAQGRVEAAATSIHAALAAETSDRLTRARLCIAQVEIALAAGDDATARDACEELHGAAAAFGSVGLEAASERARGATLLAAGDVPGALRALKAACRTWQELDAPYDAAKTRLLLAQAYRVLGDEDAATLEFDAARDAFERLGAAFDARATEELRGSGFVSGGLTEREAEVLRLVAAGKSNQEIAAELFISKKTVARHISNIFTKLNLTSRTAVAAYAFEHGLASPRRG